MYWKSWFFFPPLIFNDMCTLRKVLSVPHQMLQKHPSRQYPTHTPAPQGQCELNDPSHAQYVISCCSPRPLVSSSNRTSCWFSGRCRWPMEIWTTSGKFWRATSTPPQPTLTTCSECVACFQAMRDIFVNTVSLCCWVHVLITEAMLNQRFEFFNCAKADVSK